MGKKRRFSRLGMKLVGVSVLGLALAFAVFYLVDSVAAPWLLYSDRFAPFWQRRNADLVQAYQDYVTEKGLTVQQAMEDKDSRLSAIGGVYIVLTGTMPSVEVSADEDFHFQVKTDTSNDVSYGVTWAAPAETTGTVSFGSVEFVTELYLSLIHI